MDRLGPEDYQSNRHIRKLLRLAGATKGDVFYDLGCGVGQLCVVAVTEFGVRKAVGIEMHHGRAEKAAARVKELGLSDRIEIRNEDFMESDIHDVDDSILRDLRGGGRRSSLRPGTSERGQVRDAIPPLRGCGAHVG